jgi:hypothetical protein
MANKATVSVDLDTASLKKGIASVLTEAKKLDNLDPTVKVNVDDSQVSAAKSDIESLGQTQTLKIDGSQASGVIENIKKEFSSAFESLKGGDAGGALGGLTNGLAAAFPLAGALSSGMELLSGTVGAVAGAFSDAYAAGKEFNETIKQLSISTGLTGADLGKLEEAADNAFVKGVGESASEAAKIVGSLRQTLGDAIPLDSLDEAAIRSNQVAKSLGIETPELVGKLSPLIKQYGLSFDNALNLVASGAQKGVTDIGGYLDTIQEFTPNLKEAGFSAEEFTGLLGKAGTVGLKDFAKVGDGIKELQNRIKSGDLLTQLQGIGGETSKQLENLARQAQKGTLSGKEVLTQSIAEIDKAFKDGKISESLRGQLLTTFGGSIAEDIGSEAYSKIFSAPIDTAAVKKAAQAAGQVIDSTIPPPDFGRIFELAKKEIGQALNTVYNAVIVPIINPIIEGFGKIKDAFAGAFGGGAASGFMDTLKLIGSIIGGVVNVAITAFAAALKIVFTAIRVILAPVQILWSGLQKLAQYLLEATGAGDLLSNAFNFLKSIGDTVYNVIVNLSDAIVGFIDAVASFDVGKIKDSLTGFDNLTVAKKKDAAATEDQAKAAEDLKKAQQGGLTPEEAARLAALEAEKKAKAAEAAKKYAEELAAANKELADLTRQEQKRAQLRDADRIENETERQIKILQIERDFATELDKLELAKLDKKKKLSTLEQKQREILLIKIKQVEEDAEKNIQGVRAKGREDELRKAEEQSKKLADIAAKFAEQQLARLRDQLASGDNSIAGAVIQAQRAAVERGLSASIDAIIEQTPQYQAELAKLNKELAAGLDPAEYRKRADAIRQNIFIGLQGEPADTKNIYALQIRAAYTSAGDEIAKGTAEIVAQIRQQQVKQAGDIFADSLRGIGEALRSVDFATIYGDAASQAASLNEEQEKLIQNLKDGETSYQDAVDSLAELTSKQQGAASATAQAIAASFQAIADQQAKAAEDGIDQRNQNLERIRQIADEELQLAKDKAAALKAIEDQQFEDEKARQAARESVNADFAQKEKNLTNERDKLAKQSEEVQTAALNNLAVSAGAAFASLVAGGENAGEALKKVVGQTVSALLDLYTPSILALFSSIIPPPFGQIAGLAAVQGLKALLNAALNGFEEGGYTGNAGTKQVAGVVHGQEFVMTADVTRKNRALLEHLHSGKSVESFPALQKMLAENQISTIPVTELQLMRGELSAIRQRLDSMPNGIEGSMGVDVNVGMDTYLYERDRSRMIARKLRG